MIPTLEMARRAVAFSRVKPTKMMDEDDLVQEAWLNMSGVQDRAVSERHLVDMAAKLLKLNSYERSRRESRQRDDPLKLEQSAFDPELAMTHEEEFLSLTRLLPEKDRRFLRLVVFDGVSKEEAGRRVYGFGNPLSVHQAIYERMRPKVRKVLQCRY